MMGGKCNRCGFDKNFVALEFHHLDKQEKDFSISSVANKSWDSIVEELKKCELICSNCHRIEHSNHYPEILEEAKRLKSSNRSWKE